MMQTKRNATGWIICALAAIFYCYEFLLRIEPSVMVSELMHAFQANATELGVLSAFYYFIYTPMQLVVGMLLDLYGSRRILTLAVSVCAIGSYIFSAAHTLPIASVGRLMIGFGSAFAFVAVLKLAASWLPQRFFACFVGIATALGMFGAMSGVIILSSLVHTIGWKHTINIGTIMGVLLLPLVWIIIRDNANAAAPQENKTKAKPPYRATFNGLIQILKNPQMWLIGLIGCLMYLALSLFAELWGIPFLTTVYNLSKSNAATAGSMVFLGWLIGSPIIGYISDVTYSRRKPIVIGLLLSALFISLIIYLPQMPIAILYLLLFLFGVASSAEILCFAISSENNPRHLVATASSFTNSLVMLGGIIFQPLIGKLLDLFWSGQLINGDRLYSTINYQYALTVLPIAFLLGAGLTFWLRETRNSKV